MITAVGHGYLLSRNVLYNGGLLGNFLQQINVTIISSKLNVEVKDVYLEQYLKEYFFNTTKPSPQFNPQNGLITSYDFVSNNNLLTTSFAIIYMILVFIICLVISFLWILWRVCKNNPKFQKWLIKLRKKKVVSKKYSEKEIGKIFLLSEKEILMEQNKFLNRNLFLSAICVILGVGCLLSFILSAASLVQLQSQMLDKSVNNSLTSAMGQILKNIDTFFRQVLNESFNLFSTTINSMSTSIQTSLENGLKTLTNNLMDSFGVTNLFTVLKNLIKNLQETITNMQYIASNSQRILSQIDQLKGKFTVYKNQLKETIGNVCQNRNNDPQCLQYLNDVDALYVPIETQNINTESSINMLFVIQQFQLNITQLSIEVENFQIDFNNNLKKQRDAKIQELNLIQSFNDVFSQWKYISNAITPLKTSFDINKDSLSETFNKILSIFLITSLVILLSIFLIISYFLLSILRYSVMYYYEKVILLDKMKAHPTRPDYSLHNKGKRKVIDKLKRKLFLPHWTIYLYLLLFSLILIVLIMYSIFTVSIGEVFYNEVCWQFWNPEGLKNSDKILDSFVTNQWIKVAKVIPSNNAIPINITQPQQLIQSIRNNCTDDVGLIAVFQWLNIINMSDFLWSPQNLKALKDGLNFTYQTLIELNTNNLIPPDMQNFLNLASNVTKYFDRIDYMDSINELNKSVIVLTNLSQWIDKTLIYFGQRNDQQSILTVKTLNNVNSNVISINNTQNLVDILKSSFIEIQKRRTNNILIEQLVQGLKKIPITFKDTKELYNNVSIAYNEIMMKNFTKETEVNLSQLLNTLLTKIFPCKSLSQTFDLILNTFCTKNQFLESLVNFGFVFIILSIFLWLIFHFHFFLIRIDFRKRDDKNVSTC